MQTAKKANMSFEYITGFISVMYNHILYCTVNINKNIKRYNNNKLKKIKKVINNT